MTEKELIEIEIAHLQGQIKEKQKKLEELEKEPEMLLMRQGKVDIVDYDKTTYYRIEYTTDFARSFNWYKRQKVFSNLMPILNNGPLFEVLEKYYQKEVMKQKQEYPYKKYTEEETEQSLKEAFKKAQQSEKWKEIQKLIDEEDNDKNFKNSLDLIKEWGEKNKPKTLYGILQEWWNDILAKNSDLDFDISIDYLVDLIDTKFIPPSSKTNSYEWEKCLKMMRDNLRDT